MKSELKVIDAGGKDIGSVEIDEKYLESEKGEQAVHDTVVAHLANKRAGTACAKTRSQVRGGGAKPWRQKGTGRARAGSIRSPIWSSTSAPLKLTSWPTLRPSRPRLRKDETRHSLDRPVSPTMSVSVFFGAMR